MSVMVTDYDWQRNALLVSSPAIPSVIRLHKEDDREREVYTARVYEYVPRDRLEQIKEKLEEYDNYIQWLFQFVPEDRWDEVLADMASMRIDYRGADDV